MPAAEPPHEEPEPVWEYEDSTDPMTGQITHYAMLLSTTTHAFGFPYSGGTHCGLRITKHPRNGLMVTVKIDKGQFTCHSYTRCRILVRFDDRPPIKFRGSEPADNSSDLIFLEPEKQFIKELKKSKTVAIELPFFQEGSRIFAFNVEGLKWD